LERTPRSANMIGSQIGAVMIRKTSAASSTMKTVPSRLFSDPIHGEVQKNVSSCALRLKQGPASASFRIDTICVSVNLDLRMMPPPSNDGRKYLVIHCALIGGAYV